MFDLHIVIVNYNTSALLRACLASLAESDFAGACVAVTVVDNDSPDDSADMVAVEFPQVRLIRNENLGFAHGNNLGLHTVPARYHLLLNPDTLLPPHALAQTLAYMEAHPSIGALGVRLVLADGSLDMACRRGFPTLANSFYKYSGLARLFPHNRRFAGYNLTYLNPDETAEVDSLVGAFMLLRHEALAEIGSLDESFFMYGEDLDLCYRLKSLGWQVVYWPDVTVLHYKRAASSRSARAQHEFYRAMRLFYDKLWPRRLVAPQRTLAMAGISAAERFIGYRSKR